MIRKILMVLVALAFLGWIAKGNNGSNLGGSAGDIGVQLMDGVGGLFDGAEAFLVKITK